MERAFMRRRRGNVKTRYWLAALAATAIFQTRIYALTPPSDSDGPVRLLSCSVSAQRVLEAEVDNRTEDAMNCNIRCDYALGEKTFSHSFNVTIPGRFQGHVGKFDTNEGKPGNYSGEIGTCKKVSLRG
jgi:phosphate-selective porin